MPKDTGKKLADMLYGQPFDVPTPENLRLGQQMIERELREKAARDAKLTPLDKAKAAYEAAKMMGSAAVAGIGSIPTRIVYGPEAAEKYVTSRISIPETEKGMDYVQNVGDFLEQLETKYKLPPILPEAMALQYLSGPATKQATRAAKQKVMQASKAGERYAERKVPQIMERGGAGADILSGLAQGSRSQVYRPTTPLKPDPSVGTRYKKQFKGGLAPRKDLNIEDFEKSSVKIFPHDATSRNYEVTEVSEIPLTRPVLTEGGDDYMRDLQHMKDRIATASNPGIAKRIQKRIDQAAIENQLLGGTGKVYGFPVRMGDLSERAATFPADIAMDLLMQGGLSKREMAALTKDLRTMAFEGKGRGYFKDVAPIGTPEFEMQLREGLKADKEKGISGVTDMNLRKGLMDRLALVENQKRLGYNIQDLTNAVLADELKGVPKGYVGNVAAELDPFTSTRPSKSSTYGLDIGGLYEGSMPNMPVEFLMPNTFEGIYREMKREYPNAKPEALRNMTIGAMEKRNEGISEMIGARSVDAVKTYQEGLKQGEFDPNNITEVYDFMRRKKLGLELAAGGSVHISDNPDVMQLELAGGKKKGGAVSYADGGEITADDLILEERKL